MKEWIIRLSCLAGLALLLPATLTAQCLPGLCTGDIPTGQCGIDDAVCTGSPNTSTGACAGNGCNFVHNCRTPTVSGPTIEILPQANGTFTARLKMDVRAPWNKWAQTNNPNGTLDMFWYERPTTPGLCDTGFNIAICEYLNSDHTQCWVQQTGLTCAGAPYNFGTFSFRAQTCGGPGVCNFPFPPTCGRWVDRSGLDFVVSKEMLGCPTPRKTDCNECKSCKRPGGGDCGANVTGEGASCKLPGAGAHLYYAAGGAGGDGFPGTAAWRPSLGRYWSHDYAQRIVVDPDDSHVWLITETATFREFGSKQADGRYATTSPSDEHRKLYRTASGWELRGRDGSVAMFDSAGLWTRTEDRNGNAKVAAYSGGRISQVTFPDGRSETFGYHASGKLASVTEVGVGGAASRTWSYTWLNDDLVRVDRPDGTAWELFYTDSLHPGYLTRRDLIGTDASRRVEFAAEYDAQGNVIKMWRGATSFSDPNAVDTWSFGFDDPAEPATATATDPLGKIATYTIGRDTVSDKPRITSIAGDCPSCGLGTDVELFYEDPAHPLLETRIVDTAATTLYTYNADGLPTSKTEAAGTPLERTTTWEYAGPHPASVTRIERPSTSGTGVAATVLGYDAAGNPTTRTATGFEAGSAFSHTTATAYNAAGQPTSLDPPGFGTQDQTTFTYDPSRGDLLPLTRTDPLIGTTSFAYDAFNRLATSTDPNGVAVETSYDALNRTLATVQKGAAPAEDLVTTNVYNPFGDLVRIVQPAGNVVEHGYDAAGRLVSIERKPDALTPGERTLYTLNASGDVTREELQRWNGSAWVTEASTEFVYASRCHLDRIVHPDGSATEYAYDCQGRLEREWDANHPSAGKTSPATRTYTWDALNRRTSVTAPWAGGGSAVTSYAYDARNNTTRVTDPNGTVTTFTYSDRGLLTTEVSEVSGTTTFTYDEHGVLAGRTDARNLTTLYTVDALGRTTFADFPDNVLDTAYTWDDPNVPFSKGRLTAVTRNGETIPATYDRFGRTTRDGALTYSYDKNGNRLSIGYPGAVTATYTYDFADREATLSVQDGSNAPQPVVTAASYKPFGPLASLGLGNGLTETRAFDSEYSPTGISVPGRLDWTYTTDAMGHVTAITDNLNAGGSRSFVHQDVHYFLTQGNGPWGTRSWTWDKAGNRLTEVHDGVTDTYTYAPNAAGGSSPRLSQVTFGAGGSMELFHDAAGNLVFRARGDDKLRLAYDAGGRLSQLRGDSDSTAQGLTQMAYDGRDQLSRTAFQAFAGAAPERETTATYDSGGRLHHRAHLQRRGPTSPRNQPEIRQDGWVLYFGSRPAGILEKTVETPPSGAPTTTTALTWLTTDHLDTPVLATDAAGSTVWQGGFEPFGADWNAARSAGIFLRLPGQWDDATWDNAKLPSGLSFNANRWYSPATGRYTSPDPVQVAAVGGISNLSRYLYADGDPIDASDPLGLYTVIGPPDFQQSVDGAMGRIADAIQNNKNPQCCKYFSDRNIDLPTWTQKGGAPYIVKMNEAQIRAAEKKGTVCSYAQQGSPFLYFWVNPNCFKKPNPCKLASLLLHEMGHLARQDTTDNEPSDFFKDCNLGCASPGDYR